MFLEIKMSRYEIVCDMCGSTDVVHDRREGHVVCMNCGGVLEERTTCEHSYDDSTRTSYGDVSENYKRRKVDMNGGMKARVSAFIDNHHLSEAVKASAMDVLEVLPRDKLRDRDLDAWAVIALACELSKSCRSMTDLAALSGSSTGKLLGMCKTFKPLVESLYEDKTIVVPEIDATLSAMMSFMQCLYSGAEFEKRKRPSRRHVLNRSVEFLKCASFMNLQPDTRGRALLYEYLEASGDMGVSEKKLLRTNAVKNALSVLKNAGMSFKPPSTKA